MSTPPHPTDTFPSLSQYQRLKQKYSKEGYESLSKAERTLNRSYNYAYQTVLVGKPWPTGNDPLYDPIAVAAAERMFRIERNKRTPDLPEPKVHSDEEVAHVAACAKLIRLYLDHGETRRRAAFRGLPVPDPLPLIPTERMTAAEIEAAIGRMTNPRNPPPPWAEAAE